METLRLEVLDDGRGIPDGGRRSGLSNMRRRAERQGGTFTVAPRDPAGTALSLERADGTDAPDSG